jgi:transcriptional regulator with XRE-family HTH domain
MNIEIANRLVELRKKSGLSQEELAAKLGLSRQAVSKWERAEASPDTDNLICLAKLYGVSLDHLLNTDESIDDIVKEQVKTETDPSKAPDPASKPADASARPTDSSSSRATSASAQNTASATDVKPQAGASSSTEEAAKNTDAASNAKGDKRESVHIGIDGIHVTDKDGSCVDIDTSGIHLNDKGFTGKFSVDGAKEARRSHRYKIASAIVGGILGILAIAAFLLLGFLLTNPDYLGWRVGWLCFLAVPVATSFIEALRRRRFCSFAFPVVVIGIYLFLGLAWGLWHPEWVMLFAIPVYYTIFGPVDHLLREKLFDTHGININVFGNNHDDDDDDEDDKKNKKDDKDKDKDDKVIDVDAK